MTATLRATKPRVKRPRLAKPLYDGKPMTLEHFREWSPEDGFKYEWNNGFLEAHDMIKPPEIYIIENLRKVFDKTSFKQQGGAMVTETICPISEGKYRVPDLSFLTKAQIEEAREGKFPIPAFVIELVSERDTMNYYDQKLDEYFSAGVQCVWLVSPLYKKVRVYRSPKEVKICTGEDMCSAMPAVPDFQLSVNQVFQL
ncbi:MAG: Uma2 family endonuclease [Chloroherpetonaceae bacterium]